MAWIDETALDDGMVLGVIAEYKIVADCSCDGGRVEGKFGISADGDGDVFSECEGNEEGEEGSGNGGMHRVGLRGCEYVCVCVCVISIGSD